MQRFKWVTLVAIFWGIPYASMATDAATVAKTLPHEFAGTYQWRGDKDIYRFRLAFSSVEVTSKGDVEALGAGEYLKAGKIGCVNIRVLINPATGAVEIWESDPRTNLAAPGSHKGQLSWDRRKLNTVWTANGTGRRGDTSLVARRRQSNFMC
jgi:hypothetical protein